MESLGSETLRWFLVFDMSRQVSNNDLIVKLDLQGAL